jgi:hypothetical protein
MKFYYKSPTFLKGIIVFLAVFFFTLSQIISVIFLNKSVHAVLIDSFFALVTSIVIIEIAFYLFHRKEKQLDKEVEQLIDAYQYIGKINRKIDALLDLDISDLDHSKNHSLNESAIKIFRQLVNLLSPQSAYLCLNPPINLKMHIGRKNEIETKHVFELLKNKKLSEFKYNSGTENEKYFFDLGVGEDFIKKYNFVAKPVYMHDKDIGLMFLVFKKNQQLEERDFNIIRFYSFYIALNYTFRPDFSIEKT